jgi:hypothetical protein
MEGWLSPATGSREARSDGELAQGPRGGTLMPLWRSLYGGEGARYLGAGGAGSGRTKSGFRTVGGSCLGRGGEDIGRIGSISKGIEAGGLGTTLLKGGIVSVGTGIGASNTDLVDICKGGGTD